MNTVPPKEKTRKRKEDHSPVRVANNCAKFLNMLKWRLVLIQPFLEAAYEGLLAMLIDLSIRNNRSYQEAVF